MCKINKILPYILSIYLLSGVFLIHAQTNYFTQNELLEDFIRFREILENEHCCLNEYIAKTELDSLFDAHFNCIDHKMMLNEFFILLSPITAKIGCMHTATWMPGRFYITKPNKMFPFTLKLINKQVIITSSYEKNNEVPFGSIILEINGKPIENIIEQFRKVTSADALNPYFIEAKLIKRFSMLYASVFGLPDKFEIKCIQPNTKVPVVKTITPTNHESVRKVVYSHFNNPKLEFKMDKQNNTAIMTVKTFVYYDKVEYFRTFMDSCFSIINEKKIKNLILDLRGNGGGDPFCASILFSYLQKKPVPYYSEPYEKYEVLANPIPFQQNQFCGNLYTLLDGSSGSTNGHFCALLKYHRIGKFVGTPSGSTYKCNAGKNTEFRLPNSNIIITIGRSTYSSAVFNMDKTRPIMPDIYINETYNDFLDNRDVFVEKAMEYILSNKE